MQELTVNLLNQLELKPLDNPEAVRRQGNAYALNGEGKLWAVSMTGKDIPELNLGEECKDLEYLYLAYNQYLREIQFEVETPKLKSLYLNNCALLMLHLPSNLEALKQLYVQKNQLFEINFRGDCPELELLDVSENKLQLFELPASFPKLTYLFLHKNQIEDLKTTQVLPSLNILDLRWNKLEQLSLPWLESSTVENLFLHENPLSSIPREFIAEGEDGNSLDGVRGFLLQLQEGDNIINDRAKLIIVGNGRVGKTSLWKRLKGEAFDDKEEYTHGIQIGQLEKKDFPDLEADSLQLKVWDFGGQDIFYATHQFFLSEEAIYILAWTNYENVRAYLEQSDLPDNEKWRDNGYWLDNIRLHGKTSPIVMVQTHSDFRDNKLIPDQAFLESPYQVTCYEFSAKKQRGFGLEELKECISEKLKTDIPFFGQPFPKSFETVIRQMENATEMMIPLSSFNQICTEAGVLDGIEKEVLKSLHKSGVVVYFDQEGLNDVVFTNPNWLTDQVYKLINNQLKAIGGRIDEEYLLEVFPEPAYGVEDRNRFLALLIKFKLIFKATDEENVYIAPQYLTPKLNWEAQKMLDIFKKDLQLAFVFRYQRFMPENVMINFLSAYGPYSNQVYWRDGICFVRHQQKCIVELDPENKALKVYTANHSAVHDLQREICEAFLELGRSTDVAISLDGQAFIPWAKLNEQYKLFVQERNKPNSLLATDGETILHFKDFIHFFGREEILLEHEKTIIKLKNIKPQMTPDQILELKGLRETLDLLIEKKSALEKARVTAIDPSAQFGLDQQIKALNEEIQMKRNAIQQIERGQKPDVESIDQNSIATILLQSDKILAGVNRIEPRIESILTQLSAQDQQLLAILQISEATRSEVAQCFLELDQKPTDPYEMEIMIGRINSLIAEQIADLPEAITQRWKALNAKSPEYTDTKGKLKLKIPIIPAILEYEMEASSDLRSIAKQIWADLKAGKIFLK